MLSIANTIAQEHTRTMESVENIASKTLATKLLMVGSCSSTHRLGELIVLTELWQVEGYHERWSSILDGSEIQKA